MSSFHDEIFLNRTVRVASFFPLYYGDIPRAPRAEIESKHLEPSIKKVVSLQKSTTPISGSTSSPNNPSDIFSVLKTFWGSVQIDLVHFLALGL